ncbi:dnaJ homolog subfamily C member 12 isoform X2 [Tachysurus fulvidraco]|uniref:dnaJ homolog subfamily C member 12 isoform X2 n=1 Tax=Tachysurus fulvidraco TaxID=1234273 RepID=UPI000F4DF67C|nr:dnaJ homolog subfamily C member 12 isoform X2 [Tachysurus fulvidraco]
MLHCRDGIGQTEQIMAEYKVRALSCHPDKQPENPEAAQDFQKLQQAKEILTDETKRKKYDYWLRSGITVPFSEFQALSDTVKMSMHWALKNKKEPMLESAKDRDEFQAGHSETPKEVPKEGITSIEELSSSGYWLHGFRRTCGTPSSLLEKFRNYQI